MATDTVARHSQAEEVSLISDDDARARKEAENALVQDERVRQYVLQVMDGRPFRLRPSIILELNRCAIDGLDRFAGNWRPGAVTIGQSDHVPPEACTVPAHVEDLCDYVNENWSHLPAIKLAAIVMWRLNWIHPFTDGNGRTSRAASYLVLCAKAKSLLPGTPTIPEQIVANRGPYYNALEAADQAYRSHKKLDASLTDELTKLLGNMLANQLIKAFEAAESGQ